MSCIFAHLLLFNKCGVFTKTLFNLKHNANGNYMILEQ